MQTYEEDEGLNDGMPEGGMESGKEYVSQDCEFQGEGRLDSSWGGDLVQNIHGAVKWMDKPFVVHSPFETSGDQQQAIDKLSQGVLDGDRYQTLKGVTGSGKTYTMAKIIEKVQRPTLILSHNKTLAAQLYKEFKSFFPENRV